MAKTEDYILKITNAAPVELVIINYDILIEDVVSAIASHGADPENYITCINGARDALMELIGALDLENPVAQQLYPIYMHVNKLLISSLVYEKKDGLDEAVKIMNTLREGWVKAAEAEAGDDALYKNTPKVYSGLTYGRKGPNDYVEEDPGRGIKV